MFQKSFFISGAAIAITSSGSTKCSPLKNANRASRWTPSYPLNNYLNYYHDCVVYSQFLTKGMAVEKNFLTILTEKCVA